MKFVWGKAKNQLNQRLEFTLDIEKDCDTLVLCAVDFYQVFLDGKLISYGPSRTASGYVRKRLISLNKTKKVTIKVASYGTNCYSCDLQSPFFGAEVLSSGKVVYTTKDFICEENSSVVTGVPKYSGQRGFIEYFDLSNVVKTRIQTYNVSSPKILGGGEDYADYSEITLEKTNGGKFSGFTEYRKGELPCDKIKTNFSVKNEIIEKDWSNYSYIDYQLNSERTGFFTLKGVALEDTELTVFFEEILVDGKWIFRRSACNDFFRVKIPKGEFNIITFEPYSCKILKVVGKNIPKDIEVGMVTLENKNATLPYQFDDEKLNLVCLSALNTFRQNAVDIFTDCPSRERAGWLCDSFFLGQAEDFFCKNNKIEKNFIENFILSKTSEIPKGMLPKCFPSQHPLDNDNFIPNWALWFILELKNYLDRTNDLALINKAKKKVKNLLKYFSKFVNEYGLLEDLDGWIFVEWSDCNRQDYIRGVNFPTNMLYAFALQVAGEMYCNKKYLATALRVKNNIKKLAFDGEFFCENAIRENGKLIPQREHLTETCQYYALFFELIDDDNFSNKMISEFGPSRKDSYSNVSRSNVFIGNYLRLFLLLKENQKNKIIQECKEYYYNMAIKTGTLWERDMPSASCNHGFASVIAKVIFEICK